MAHFKYIDLQNQIRFIRTQEGKKDESLDEHDEK